jgi:polyisoprenoid-binding protein YceI
MRRTLWIGLGALVLLVLLAGAGGYAYFFSGLRTAPEPLALASPSPGATPSASPATAGALTGTWTVTSGSQAGYRVKEQFVGQTSQHEAVARTSAVSGDVTLHQGASGLQATSLQFTAQVGQLKSVDSVAGYNVTNRDRIVQGALQAGQFPTASFQADTVALPDTLSAGQAVTLTVPGKITIKGVTKDATATVQVQVQGSGAQVAGSVPANMADFGISPPQVPFTKSESAVTIEFQLVLTKA